MSTSFLLMRHGHADWARVRHCIGWGADVVPLSDLGRQQVRDRIADIKAWQPTIILSSPMTRSLETATIVSQALFIPIEVRFELHEWIPKLSMDWRSLDEVTSLQNDLMACGGEWPAGQSRDWEPLSRVRSRALSVLDKCGDGQRVLVTAHRVLMYALTGQFEIANAEIIDFRSSP